MTVVAIDAGALLDVIWSSLLAGASITLAFSVALYASVRLQESRRTGRPHQVIGFAMLAALCGAAIAAALVYGFIIMTSK